MKTTNPIPAPGGQTAQAAFGLGRRGASNRRKSVIAIALGGLPLISIRGLNMVASLLATVAAGLVRAVAPRLTVAAVYLAVYGAVTVAVVVVGTRLMHSSLRTASAMTDSAYRTVGEARTAIALLLPRFTEEDGAPRAQLVAFSPEARGPSGYPRYPTDVEVASPDVLAEAPGSEETLMVGLLPPLGGEKNPYPAPPGLPPIEGKILADAGGDRIQELITQVLASMHHVEASGQLELVGDNGLAFGPLQVRREPCEDLKRLFGVTVVPKECNGDWLLSEYVVRLYAGFWANELEKKTGESARGEDILRIWNGGPDMGPMSKTDLYVAKAVAFDRKVARIAAVNR